MPEGPEVRTIVYELNEAIKGDPIRKSSLFFNFLSPLHQLAHERRIAIRAPERAACVRIYNIIRIRQA